MTGLPVGVNALGTAVAELRFSRRKRLGNRNSLYPGPSPKMGRVFASSRPLTQLGMSPRRVIWRAVTKSFTSRTIMGVIKAAAEGAAKVLVQHAIA